MVQILYKSLNGAPKILHVDPESIGGDELLCIIAENEVCELVFFHIHLSSRNRIYLQMIEK